MASVSPGEQIIPRLSLTKGFIIFTVPSLVQKNDKATCLSLSRFFLIQHGGRWSAGRSIWRNMWVELGREFTTRMGS